MCLKHIKYEKSTTFNKSLLMGEPLPTFPFEILPI